MAVVRGSWSHSVYTEESVEYRRMLVTVLLWGNGDTAVGRPSLFTHKPIGHLNPEKSLIEIPSKMILDCVKLTIQANHHTWIWPLSSYFNFIMEEKIIEILFFILWLMLVKYIVYFRHLLGSNQGLGDVQIAWKITHVCILTFSLIVFVAPSPDCAQSFSA